jgi:hypothetical protein
MFKIVLVLACVAFAISGPVSCSGSSSGNGVLDVEDDFQVLEMQADAFSQALTCSQKKICTFTCTNGNVPCTQAVYFSVGDKKPRLSFTSFLAQNLVQRKFQATSALSEDEDDTLDVSPEDATVESLTRFGGNIRQPITTPLGTNEMYPKLSQGYNAFCITPRSALVNQTIDSMINQAIVRDAARFNTKYSSWGARLFGGIENLNSQQFNSKVVIISAAPALAKLDLNRKVNPQVIQPKLFQPQTFQRVLETETEAFNTPSTNNVAQGSTFNFQVAPVVALIRLLPTPSDETLGQIMKDFAHGINRLCEDDELIASTPLEFLTQLWSNYIVVASPAVHNDVALQNLATEILTAIVRIWTVRCDCGGLIGSADPSGNYVAQKLGAQQQCVTLCPLQANPQTTAQTATKFAVQGANKIAKVGNMFHK